MEEEEKNKQRKLKIILASTSPRRKFILEKLKLDFEILVPAGITETEYKNPFKTVITNSLAKAQFVYNNVIINDLNRPGTVIAGFDTIVVLGGRYFGKPCNARQAEDYLKALSGRTHMAITGVALIDAHSLSTVSGYEVTKVKFKELSAGEIKQYLAREDVFDKAGAYDISGYGSMLVKRINGCFYNVAGLPVQKFIYLLGMLGYKWEDF